MELNIIWFALLALLFIGYVVLDGFDLGVGMNHLALKSDKDRRISINSIGPVWDANEVWLITAGGALFAAFPDVYATVFSGFYIAFMLFLLVIIGRAVAIEFRGKVDSASWTAAWDVIFCVSSYLIVVLLGITLGNIVSGIPLDVTKEYAGTFWTLLNPYSIFIGLTAVLFLKLHGRLYLLNKTEGDLQIQVGKKFTVLWILTLLFYIGLFIWTLFYKKPILTNYFNHGALFILPILPFALLALILLMYKLKRYYKGFLLSSVMLAVLVIQSSVSMFPNLVPSNPNPENSLNILNSASSPATLWAMLIIACIGLPLVIIYKIIMFSAFRGKVKLDSSSY
jgi:cytochrome d ubiquinol oxidase subunit II